VNPDRVVMEYIGRQREKAAQVERERRDALHRQAVARRRKAKRGGRR
jgi:hypothetical protein